MAGFTSPFRDQPIGPSNPTAMFGNPDTFTAAANTQASDYDKIMKNYGDIIAQSSANSIAPNSVSADQVRPGSMSATQIQGNQPVPFSPISSEALSPQQAAYNQSGDVTESLSKLSDLATTGGYDAQGIADLRARGIAPTRSIYANAQQNVERQRALAGGYSPNFNATQAQLARDESSQIGDITTNVNAGIAQNVASNRLQAAPAYANASATANAARTEADRHNADIINQINSLNERNRMETNEFNTTGAADVNKFNASGQQRVNEINAANKARADEFNTSTANAAMDTNAARRLEAQKFNVSSGLQANQQNQGTALEATRGQANLYGTTPALTNTFGNQVVQAAQLGQNQQGLNNQRQRNVFDFARMG